jgi:hypothetical protein
MKEQFLHYVWLYKKFDFNQLLTTCGLEIFIQHSGYYTQREGPDFFNAQLIIDGQKWAGNIEIHLKSSDWYLHHHENDNKYENVILHVVWEHDMEVFRKNNASIPVLELKQNIPSHVVQQYHQLLQPKSWINCENEIRFIDEFTKQNWMERLFFERLEKKSNEVEFLLQKNIFDWEATFFQLLAKSFGLNTNGEVFLTMAIKIPYSIIKKERYELENIEALFLGATGLLEEDNEDFYFNDLKKRWHYLKHKYQFDIPFYQSVQFFKHRPDNFPTIRLAQLAKLVFIHTHFFQTMLKLKSVRDMYAFFDCSISDYWQTHYVFDKPHPNKAKKISKAFKDLLIINCILPLQFNYYQVNGNVIPDDFIALASEIPTEKNSIVEKFNLFGLSVKNSFQSQAVLQLKKEYCNSNECLQCAIGQKLINFTSK